MARITFMKEGQINGRPSYLVTKDGPCVASIYFVGQKQLKDQGGGLDEPHWVLKHPSGRLDRHPSLEEAKNDALKI